MENFFSFDMAFSIVKVLAALLLVLLNGIFVAAEFAFVKVRPTRIAQLAAEGNKKAEITSDCIENIDAYLSVSQLGITLSSLGLGWLGEPAIATLLTPILTGWGIASPALVHSISFILAFSLITFLHVVFGELAPKSLAIQRAEGISMSLAKPMRFFYYVFYPAVALLNGTANKFLFLLGFQPASESEIAHSEEELRMLISESYKGGHIKKSEQELLQNVFRFEERVVQEIMVPRPEVVFLNIRDSLEENIALARKSGHSRYPLCDGGLDKVIGLINIKDLLYLEDKIEDISSIGREIMFVPEGMRLDHLLPEFQKKHQHMAVVIDEYGGISGIVTMENILEELVGPIQDEFDDEDPEVIVEEGKTLLVTGRILLDDAEERFALSIDDEEAEQYYTLAGYMLGKLGKRPREGDIVILDNMKLEIVKMEGMRIDRIRLHPIEHSSSKIQENN